MVDYNNTWDSTAAGEQMALSTVYASDGRLLTAK